MKPPLKAKQSKGKIIPRDFKCLAKTVQAYDGKIQEGVDVLTHCKIVGLVALELIHRQPEWLRKALYPPGTELIAAAHDIGKISPGFQEKIYHALNRPLQFASLMLDRNIGGHVAVSKAALSNSGPFIPEILGRHHGFSSLKTGLPDDEIYGGLTWQTERMKTVNGLKAFFEATWPEVHSDIHADVLTGLTTVSDWIGSGDVFASVAHNSPLSRMVSKALDLAGFVKPKIRKDLSFENIFPNYTPYSIQELLIQNVASPGVYVMEAPMGTGKTEAALYSAYKAIVENQATGIYFALPTQLTSNKMFARMNQFLETILEKGCPHRKSLLLHGAAWLNNTCIGEEGVPGKSWFDYRKRGLLAPFAVGTIDQALMAVMNVKHGFVRTFGLAGKVVILDEVHSYDSYTGTIIDYLVKALKEIHCTVIILSATLTMNRRFSLLCSNKDNKKKASSAYPLVSAFPKGGNFCSFSAKCNETTAVQVYRCGDDNIAINEALVRAERGEQVLWIENTVNDAQRQFQVIAANASDLELDCGLLHSRFLKTDREKNETTWVELYGKAGQLKRCTRGRILVGTQVLEQSLDIDSDFLISRICPTDMLLQRIGRLWRHRQNDEYRPSGARREAWILSPRHEDAVAGKKAFGKTAMVYAPYVLYRTLEIFFNNNPILLPDHMRKLIEATYSERIEDGRLAHYKRELEQRRETLSRLAQVGISRGGKTLPESKAATRYSDIESIDVLLVLAKRQEKDGTHLRLLDDTLLFLPKSIRFKDGKQWRKAATILLKNTVTVPEWNAPAFVPGELEFLKEFVYLGNNEEHPFRVTLVRNSGELCGLGQQTALEGYRLRYDSVMGYIADKL